MPRAAGGDRRCRPVLLPDVLGMSRSRNGPRRLRAWHSVLVTRLGSSAYPSFRFFVAPMITWLILSALGFAGAQWVTDRNKREMEDRFFDLRLQVTARALSEIAANSTGSNAGDQDLVPWGGSVDGYLAHAIAVGGAQLYVVDSGNTIIASSEVLPSVATGLSVVAPELSNAPWSEDVVVVNGMRFARFDIPGRPWRLIGGAPLVGMYGPIDSSNMVIRIAAGGGSGLGLLTVILVGSISRNREVLRESEELRRHRQELTVRAYQLEAANAELKIANDRVADLVAMLSHDVRQPIATVIGLCELLIGDWLDASDDDKRGDVEKKIAATAASMNNLVEEILTLTQLDGDTLLARPTPLNVRGVVNDVLTHMAPDRQAQVTVEIDPALRVLADPRHLHQILTNLVGNALNTAIRPCISVRRALAVAASRCPIPEKGCQQNSFRTCSIVTRVPTAVLRQPRKAQVSASTLSNSWP